jgi:hypothetical protein
MAISAQDIGIKATAAAEDRQAESTFVTDWLKEIDDATKREKDFRKEGRRIVEIYEGKKKREYQFNILFSNTETMLPALYNSLPRPLVSRRFKSEDPLGKMAAKATERTLEYLMDNGDSEYSEFDQLMASATLEALLPGRGMTRFKYDAVIEKQQAVAEAEASDEGGQKDDDEGTPQFGDEPPAILETVPYETVCGEEIPWDRFLHGSAKKWRDIPWGAIQHFMTREELEASFGEVGAKVPVVAMVEDRETRDDAERNGDRQELRGLKVAEVYEIWDKITKKVIFVSPQWKESALKQVDDPLNLSGFYPWPKPISFIAKISTLTPVALYTMYEEQAKELNLVTTRINKIVAALKVRGFYDSTVEGLDKVLQAEDNTLIPAENVAGLLGQGNSLDKAIFLMPIEKLVTVLQQLYVQREQVKTVIYDLTGIADIMRGSSAASETLGAQQIKNQWGTMRLKKSQKEVQRYARDCLRIMAEIAMSKLSPETLSAMTGLPYPTGLQKQQAGEQMQAIQQQQAMAAQQAQMTGQQPPPPQPPPPQLQEMLSLPSWDDILGMLRDDIQRNYRIDIETNSTVDAEATEDKEDLGELMNAMSQFLNGIGPMVSDGTMPFDVAQGMLLEVVRRYRFGSDMEDAIKKMQPPQSGAKPEEIKAQQAQLEQQAEALKQQQAEMEKQLQDAQKQLEQQQNQVEQGLAKQEQAMSIKLQQQEQDLAAQKREAEMDIELERKQFEFDKALALQEIAFAKQTALKEIEFATKTKEAEADQRIRTKEHGLQLKQAAFAENAARQKEADSEGKAEKQSSDGNKALMQGLEKVGSSIVEGLSKAKPKTARKQPDGSWTTD